METINKVRTRHFVQGKNISEIARELNLSRNTVKKYLKNDYPLSYQREKQPQPLLGSFHPQLLDMLNHDAISYLYIVVVPLNVCLRCCRR